MKKVLHHRCFLNHFVKLFRTGLSDCINPLSSNPTKWSRTLKQFVGKLPTNCFSVFDHFVGLLLKGLTLLSLLKNDYVLAKQTNTQQANVRVPNIYQIIPALLLLTLNICLPQINSAVQSLRSRRLQLFKGSVALKTHRNTRMVTRNFSKATSSWLKAYYLAINAMFAIHSSPLLLV